MTIIAQIIVGGIENMILLEASHKILYENVHAKKKK